MSFKQLVQYKALDRMYGVNDSDFLFEAAMSNPENAEQVKANLRNVCALISVELFNDLEGICGLLDMTKRKFIENALIFAIDEANIVIRETGLLDRFPGEPE